MKSILVTGGAGFIGSNFIRNLLQQERVVRVINLDALTYSGSLENLRDLPGENRYQFVHGNICDADLVQHLLQEYKIDTVVHFAAESHVDRSILGPGLFVQTNVVGTFTLLEAVKKVWSEADGLNSGRYRFHHISTDEVFGTLAPGDPAWTEDVPYAPSSPYSASKAASDHLVRAYGHTYGLPYTLTNCSNNYGPYQFPEKLIPLIILNALEQKPLPVYGDGGQIRDWLHVQDHCDAILQVIKHAADGSGYNIGGGNQPTNLSIVKTICDLMDELAPVANSHQKLITFVKDRPGHDRRYAMDSSKIQHELGWRPKRTLESGLRETVTWYLDHPQWVKSVRRQVDYQTWVEQNYNDRT